MKPKFCKGDRVRLRVNHPSNKPCLRAGDIGTVISGFDDYVSPEGCWASIYIVDWGKDVDGLGVFGGASCWCVSETLIEPALETETPELAPSFTDLL